MKRTGAGLAIVIGTILTTAPARADSVEQFYKGRQVTFVIGFNPGGGYDLYARLIARHMARYIPGTPNLVVKNMGGAGSLIAANYMGNRAPRDGTEVGMIEGSIAVDPIIGGTPTKFDSRKFYWLGSANVETGACFAHSDAKYNTLADAYKHEIVTGTAAGSTLIYPTAMNSILGTKLKLVSGYKGSNGLMLAFERKEVEAICGNIYTTVRTRRPHWLKAGGSAKIMIQIAMKKHPDIPNVPLLIDLPKAKDDQKVLRLIVSSQTLLGRAFFLPPGVPDDRAAALRKAFGDTMKDKAFLADAKKARADIQPLSGSAIEDFLHEVYKTPKPILARAAAILGRK
jgi:tripartite-type tricarboxylate transporter receptor subunit TctC